MPGFMHITVLYAASGPIARRVERDTADVRLGVYGSLGL